MVNQNTIDLVNIIVDTQNDINIKYTIFGLIIFYVILFWFINKSLKVNSFPKAIFKFFSLIYIYATLFFLPLFTIMLFREYAAIDLWTLILQMYGGVFVIAALSATVFGWTKVLETVGIEFSLGEFMQEKTLKGETK